MAEAIIPDIVQDIRRGMDPRRGVPKYHQLKEAIRQRIARGELPPLQQLPPGQALAESLDMTRVTVDRAFNELAQEGLLIRIQGRGTFVRETVAQVNAESIVGMLMPCKGHLWNEVVSSVISGLSSASNYYCMFVDVTYKDDIPPSRELIQRIEGLIESAPGHLIVHGASRFPIHLLDRYRGQMIFIDSFEHDEELPGCYVLLDYYRGGRLAGDYLLSLGHDHVVLFSPPIEPRHRDRIAVLDGLRDALKERGQSQDSCTVISSRQLLVEHLKSHQHPAVLCLWDSLAVGVYEDAQHLGLRIPEDLSVIGYFNTPWCDQLDPRLTSISINEPRFTGAIVDMILHSKRNEKVTVEPALIKRGSTRHPRM